MAEVAVEARPIAVKVSKNKPGFKNGVHWTQTPAGRKKMKQINNLAQKAKRKYKKLERLGVKRDAVSKKKFESAQYLNQIDTTALAQAEALALGYVQCYIQLVAAKHGVTYQFLAQRLGAALRGEEVR